MVAGGEEGSAVCTRRQTSRSAGAEICITEEHRKLEEAGAPLQQDQGQKQAKERAEGCRLQNNFDRNRIECKHFQSWV